MKKVDFFIIGAQKCGTTSLFHYIKDHPVVCVSDPKEVVYFSRDDTYKKGIEYFEEFFQKCNGDEILGTADVRLLTSNKAPERLYEYNAEAKLIVCLRDPVERAFSAYLMALRNGWETPDISFEEAMNREKAKAQEEEEKSSKEAFHVRYIKNGMYYKHIKNWLKYFNADQIIFVTADELKTNTNQVLTQVCQFIGVNSDFQVDTSKQYNTVANPRFSFINYFLTGNKKMRAAIGNLIPNFLKRNIARPLIRQVYYWNNVPEENPARLDAKTREKMEPLFSEDLESLRIEFGVDLKRKG